jgi:hypothetical protein
MKFVQWFLIVAISVAAVSGIGAGVWALTHNSTDVAKASCCPGECCYPGSPCCTGDCCVPGAPCCEAGAPCCGSDCCAEKAACCATGGSCCAK